MLLVGQQLAGKSVNSDNSLTWFNYSGGVWRITDRRIREEVRRARCGMSARCR